MDISRPPTRSRQSRTTAEADPHWRDVVVAQSCRQQLANDTGEQRVGAPHFSLSLSARRFLTAFSRLGIPTIQVRRPEIYGTDISRRFLAPRGQTIIHLAVGDYASLRILKSAYNIAYVAWEYDAISTATDDWRPPWQNQAWVLNLFDEVWVGATFVKQVFEQHGVRNVHVVPAPVPECDGQQRPNLEDVIGRLPCAPLLFDFTRWDRSARLIAEHTTTFAEFLPAPAAARTKLYLTIINPGDQRKNVGASILGFLRFASACPDSLLIIKLVAPPDRPLDEVIWDPLRHQLERFVRGAILRSDNIVFVGGFLEEDRLMQLIRAADFYLSTSFAEGLNLPVLEAMAQGTLVISPTHTAMADYLSADNCIPCKYHRIVADGEKVTGYPIGSVSRYEASPDDVGDALTISASLPARELSRRRRNAAMTVRGTYDMGGVAELIRSRFRPILACHRGTQEP